MRFQIGHDAFEQASAGGAPGGGGGGGVYDETIFGDVFGGGMDEVSLVFFCFYSCSYTRS